MNTGAKMWGKKKDKNISGVVDDIQRALNNKKYVKFLNETYAENGTHDILGHMYDLANNQTSYTGKTESNNVQPPNDSNGSNPNKDLYVDVFAQNYLKHIPEEIKNENVVDMVKSYLSQIPDIENIYKTFSSSIDNYCERSKEPVISYVKNKMSGESYRLAS